MTRDIRDKNNFLDTWSTCFKISRKEQEVGNKTTLSASSLITVLRYEIAVISEILLHPRDSTVAGGSASKRVRTQVGSTGD